MKIITVQVHSNHEPTIESFIRRMARSGFHLISRRFTGLPLLTFERYSGN